MIGARYSVWRLPCLMEDEGRSFWIGTRDTLDQAEKLRDEYVESSDGYFHTSDLEIRQEVRVS